MGCLVFPSGLAYVALRLGFEIGSNVGKSTHDQSKKIEKSGRLATPQPDLHEKKNCGNFN